MTKTFQQYQPVSPLEFIKTTGALAQQRQQTQTIQAQREIAIAKELREQDEAKQDKQLIQNYLKSPNQQTLSQIAFRNPQAATALMKMEEAQQKGKAREVRSINNTWDKTAPSQKAPLYNKWRGEKEEDMSDYPLEYNEQTAPEIEYLLKQDNDKAKQLLEEKPVSPEGERAFDIERGYLPKGASLESAEDIEKRKDRKIKQSMDLRKEFTKNSKNFIIQRSGFEGIQAAAAKSKITGEPTAAGDFALIFNFMKVLDPISTVREGEFKTAANAGALTDKVAQRAYDQVLSGRFLSPKQRSDFVERSKLLFDKALKRQKIRVKQFGGIAKRSGLSVEDVILDLEEGIEIEELSSEDEAIIPKTAPPSPSKIRRYNLQTGRLE